MFYVKEVFFLYCLIGLYVEPPTTSYISTKPLLLGIGTHFLCQPQVFIQHLLTLKHWLCP